MTSDQSAGEWVEAYRHAWTTNAPHDIRALFTENGVYYGGPNGQSTWRGHDGIVDGWLSHRDETDEWTFEWRMLGIVGDTAYVQGFTTYTTVPDYDNLWVIRFDDSGRAYEFTEWAMDRQ